MNRTLVAVVWHDAHADSPGGWVLSDNIDPNPYVVVTVGIIADLKPGHISIYQSWAADGQIDHVVHIPTGMVVRVDDLTTLDDAPLTT